MALQDILFEFLHHEIVAYFSEKQGKDVNNNTLPYKIFVFQPVKKSNLNYRKKMFQISNI